MLINWLTDNAISLTAVLISCASFYLSWRQHHLDRSDLRVARIEFELSGGKHPRFEVRLINKGKRLVIVKRIELVLNSGNRAKPHFFRDAQLNEADDITYMFDLSAIWFRCFKHGTGVKIENPLDVVRVEVLDSVENTYKQKLSRKERAKIKEIWTPQLAEFLRQDAENPNRMD